MADRIVVLGANPGRVRTIVENRLPRPRDYRSPELLALVDQLHDIITGTELPDVPRRAPTPSRRDRAAAATRRRARSSACSSTSTPAAAREDLFRIAADTHREFGRMIAVVKAAEMLDLVDTPRRIVRPLARRARFVRGGPESARRSGASSSWGCGCSGRSATALQREPRHAVAREFVLELITSTCRTRTTTRSSRRSWLGALRRPVRVRRGDRRPRAATLGWDAVRSVQDELSSDLDDPAVRPRQSPSSDLDDPRRPTSTIPVVRPRRDLHPASMTPPFPIVFDPAHAVRHAN